MTSNFNITILIAPLDWGLGHATRCIPLIQHLLIKGCTVVLAAEGKQKTLLETEFPQVKIIPLKGYRIRYSKDKRLFPFKIIQQIPRIVHTIVTEHYWLRKVVKLYNINAIVSDNRYGLYHHNIHSIFITHQLHIQSSNSWINRIMLFLNVRLISKFSECWVPDEKGIKNIAGILSQPASGLKIPTKFLGGLSRFVKQEGVKPVYNLLAVISGPEPQRSLLEKSLLNGLKNYDGKAILVRGLPGSKEELISTDKVSILNHLTANELEKAFNESEFIISRSGYTTVMDILKLAKKSILIPTPGQTEQEYLAKHLQQQKWAMTAEQDKLNLRDALQNAANYPYTIPHLDMEKYKVVLDEFIIQLLQQQSC